MNMGEALTMWTIRISLAFYFLGEGTRLAAKNRHKWCCLARGFWTTGCTGLLAHVASAFHFFHDWSHEAAYQNTARQTSELLGSGWGGGIYFNYAFILLWVADVLWWWRRLDPCQRRPPITGMTLHGCLFFMVFNATVVFEEGMTRWAGILGSLALMCLWRRRRGTISSLRSGEGDADAVDS